MAIQFETPYAGYGGGLKPRWRNFLDQMNEADPTAISFCNLIDREYNTQTPLILPLKCFNEHFSIYGPSGHGKTAISWTLIHQLIEKQRLFRDNPELGHRPHTIHIIDAKGSRSLLQNVLWAARGNGHDAIPLSVFTNSDGVRTKVFNVFENEWFQELDAMSQAEIVLDALGLTLGKNLSDEFYGDTNLMTLLNILVAGFNSIREVAEFTTTAGRKRAKKNGRAFAINEFSEHELEQSRHLTGIFNILAHYPELNFTRDWPPDAPAEIYDQRIDIGRGFNEPCIYYWYLRPNLNQKLVKAVVSTVLASLGALAGKHDDTDDRRDYPTHYVVCDEPNVAPHVLHRALTKWRESRLRFIMTMHTKSDFDRDMRDSIAGAAGLRLWLAPNSEERKECMELSGEMRGLLRSWGYTTSDLGAATFSESVSEHYRTRITIDDVLALSANPLSGIFHMGLDKPNAPQLEGRARAICYEHILPESFQKELTNRSLKELDLGPGYFFRKTLAEYAACHWALQNRPVMGASNKATLTRNSSFGFLFLSFGC